MNIAIITGTVAPDPVVTVLPTGARVVRFRVETQHDNTTEHAPVLWETSDGEVAEGDTVTVTGRVRTRFFRTGGSIQSTTEVAADRVEPGDHAQTFLTKSAVSAGSHPPQKG